MPRSEAQKKANKKYKKTDKGRIAGNRYKKTHRKKISQWLNNHALKVRAFLKELKQQPCKDCGQSFPHYVMEFDHARGLKKRAISQMTCRPWNSILIELEKCDLVCANCHCIRTFIRKQLKIKGE